MRTKTGLFVLVICVLTSVGFSAPGAWASVGQVKYLETDGKSYIQASFTNPPAGTGFWYYSSTYVPGFTESTLKTTLALLLSARANGENILVLQSTTAQSPYTGFVSVAIGTPAP